MLFFKTVSARTLILSKKNKHFSVFEPSNIHNESKEANKSHFIYYAPYIYAERSNI